MTKTTFQIVEASEIVEVRTRILRPGQWPLPEHYPQDHLSSTYHFSAKYEGQTIGVATFMVNSLPKDISESVVAKSEKTTCLQLRGMGVLEPFQRQGIGGKIIRFATQLFCEEHCDPQTTLIWFNAREHAIAFYQKLGFQTSGDFFDVPKIGAHKIMWSVLRDVS